MPLAGRTWQHRGSNFLAHFILANAVIGGLLIGLVQGLVALPNDSFIFGPETALAVRSSQAIAPYVVLLIVLLIRPEGLFGRKRIERI